MQQPTNLTVVRSEQPPARLELPPKTQAAAQQPNLDGFCERDERREEVWSRSIGGTVGWWHRWWVAPVCGWRWLVGGASQWVAPVGYKRDGLVGERRNGLGCDL